MEPCIFHENKTGFECLRRQLQRSKVLPRHLSPRLAMAVCSCRKTRTATIDISNEDFSNLKQTLKIHFDQWISTASSSALAVAWKVLCTDSAPTSSEKCLLYIIERALKGDFTLLEAEKKTCTRWLLTGDAVPNSGSNDDNDNSSNKAPKLTQRQKGLMVKKRKRKMPIRGSVHIPLNGDHIVLLYKAVGAQFERIFHKFKCVIEVDWEATNSNVERSINLTTLSVWCRSSQTLTDIRRYLQEMLSDRRHILNVMNMKRNTHRDDDTPIEHDIHLSYQLTDHFTEKVLGRKRHRNRCRQSRQRVKSLPSALDTMLCDRCQQPYSEVLYKDIPCSFHPGQRGQ
ncbi:uncharacterized protein LOC124138020 [Haliotis rufescens]|uniref:uncharacterized protein LOC124138020 n=1 Tax=Haliotis rufescens TaxID=6454 RepID=UPI001EB04D20|nr:uncharacterized protein LOC124138020 [Haliotis rufescens]